MTFIEDDLVAHDGATTKIGPILATQDFKILTPPRRPGIGIGDVHAHTLEETGRIATVVIAQISEVPQYDGFLNDELGLRDELRSKMCALELDALSPGGKKAFALVVREDMVHADELSEAIRALSRRRKIANPLVYSANPSVLEELRRIENGLKAQVARKGVVETRTNDRPHQATFEWIVAFALENGASDIHAEMDESEKNTQIRFRIDGQLVDPPKFEINRQNAIDMFAYLYNLEARSGSENSFARTQAQQCQVPVEVRGKQIVFRWASQPTYKGLKVVLRLLGKDDHDQLTDLDKLGFTAPQCEIWERVIAIQNGGTLVGGVVNSGKSRTCHVVMELLPSFWAKYSGEEPVEAELSDTAQIMISRSLRDRGEEPFLAVKRQLKRMDLDAYYQAELRDYETASVFRDVCESGHRGLGTLHAPNVYGLFDRLSDGELRIPRSVIATPGFLNLLVYQSLLPRNCQCGLRLLDARETFERGFHGRSLSGSGMFGGARSRIDWSKYVSRLERLFDIDLDRVRIRNPEGCPLCRRAEITALNGARGRIVVAEMLEPDSQILLYVREQKSIELRKYVRSMRTARFDEPDSAGKTAMEMAIYQVSQGVIDPREVELKLGTFENYEFEQERERKLRARGRVSLDGLGVSANRGEARTRPVRPLELRFGARGRLGVSSRAEMSVVSGEADL